MKICVPIKQDGKYFKDLVLVTSNNNVNSFFEYQIDSQEIKNIKDILEYLAANQISSFTVIGEESSNDKPIDSYKEKLLEFGKEHRKYYRK